MTGLLTSSTPSAPFKQTAPLLDQTSQDATLNAKLEKVPDSILCICNWNKDDGTTIFCDDCKTWQHIRCYYFGKEDKALEDAFQHSCVDCKPRPLDRQDAIARRKAWLLEHPEFLDAEELPEKKTKKPQSKTHKKKVKPTDLQLNGRPVATESSKHASPHDHPPAKKPKASHKASPSVSTQARIKRSPSHSAPKFNHHGHPLSPATTPPDLPLDFEIHAYTPQFLAHYEDTPEIVSENTTVNLELIIRMTQWSRPENGQFWKDTHCEFNNVVQRKKPNPLSPCLRVEEIELPGPRGMAPRWPRLITPSAVEKDVPMMDLNGIVGLQKDYCEDPDNRYSELSAPLPFVFFPQHIPLYIDTRRSGSNARHVRRSCRRNARLATYLQESEADWHFWLVSNRPISAGEEITLGWDFSLPQPNHQRMQRLLGLNDEETDQHTVADIVADIDQSDLDTLYQFIKRLLAEYGGCACNLGEDCAFRQFFRQYQEKLQSRPNAPKRKRAKSKPHTISPTSTGQATNSRAASEGHVDEMPENDNLMTEVSRSKPPSRDRTPARLGSFDTLGILTGPTNRDKRKVQIAETLFQKSAQEEQQPPRKKKRTIADGSPHAPSLTSKGRNSTSHSAEKTDDGADEPRYVDAGTCGSKATSPASAVSQASENATPNAASRHSSIGSVSRLSSTSASKNYCDSPCQTKGDPNPPTWRTVQYPRSSPKPRPQRRIISLTMRLMDQKRTGSLLAQQRSASAVDFDSPATSKSSHGSPSSVHRQVSVSSPASAEADTPMPDAPPTGLNPCDTSPLLTNGIGLATRPIKVKSPELRVQMPPVPAFSTSLSVTAVTTPMSANGSVVQSPFSSTNLPSPFAPTVVNGIAATPSPIKKKMSLSEYKNKANKAAASAKSSVDATHPLKTAATLADPLQSTINGDHEAKDVEHPPIDPTAKEIST